MRSSKNGKKSVRSAQRRTTVLALCMVMAAASFAFAAELPSDVKTSQNAALGEAVSALMEKEAITGDTDGLFHPEDTLTRVQVCSIIVKTINPTAAELNGTVTVNVPDSGFSDLTGYKWAKPYINYAANREIAKGYADGTFKPGSDVTFAELVTFAVRACGYTDSKLGGTWPQNYLTKAKELGFYDRTGMVTETGAGPAEDPEGMKTLKATKEMAAIVIYNAMDEIAEAYKPAEDTPQGTDQDNVAETPDMRQFTFANSSFDSDITKYSGKTLAKDVKVYVYGSKNEYKKDMTFSEKKADYRESNIYKYKNVDTPAWYKVENGRITAMVVPGDVGFSGRIYCVITGTGSRVVNQSDEVVSGIDTLTAGRSITWFAKKGLAVPASSETEAGEVYELYARNGEIQAIAKNTDSGKREDAFTEVATGGSYRAVDEYTNGLVRFGSDWYEIKENASVYVYEKGAYKAGSLSAVRNCQGVRLFDISDDNESAVDIVVIKK